VNGSFFKEGKGLKQGVPSSPILFNLVDDVFTKMLSKAAKCRLIRGLLPRVVCLLRGTARWEPQEEGVMNIVANFPSVKKPRYVDLREERQTTEGDADWLNSTVTRAHLLTRLRPVATRNLHTTQPNTLFPTYDEVVNLTGLHETKGMRVLSGK
jgi:hypothetical protein